MAKYFTVLSYRENDAKYFTKTVCFLSPADSYPPEKIRSIREKSRMFSSANLNCFDHC